MESRVRSAKRSLSPKFGTTDWPDGHTHTQKNGSTGQNLSGRARAIFTRAVNLRGFPPGVPTGVGKNLIEGSEYMGRGPAPEEPGHTGDFSSVQFTQVRVCCQFCASSMTVCEEHRHIDTISRCRSSLKRPRLRLKMLEDMCGSNTVNDDCR